MKKLNLPFSVLLQIKGYPFEVLMPDGLPVSGVILADQIKSLDWRVRDAEWICTLPPRVVAAVLQKLGTFEYRDLRDNLEEKIKDGITPPEKLDFSSNAEIIPILL